MQIGVLNIFFRSILFPPDANFLVPLRFNLILTNGKNTVKETGNKISFFFVFLKTLLCENFLSYTYLSWNQLVLFKKSLEPMKLDKRNQDDIGLAKEIEFAFNILNYNQNLIQFADSKANALLLINSIFIAALGPFIEIVRKGGNLLAGGLIGIFFIFSILSILMALAVIATRKVPEIENKSKSMFFFGHIVETRSPDGYIHEFNHSDANQFKEALLTNIFVVSKIASTKYTIYNYGQTFTLISCLFWIISFLYLVLI